MVPGPMPTLSNEQERACVVPIYKASRTYAHSYRATGASSAIADLIESQFHFGTPICGGPKISLGPHNLNTCPTVRINVSVQSHRSGFCDGGGRVAPDREPKTARSSRRYASSPTRLCLCARFHDRFEWLLGGWPSIHREVVDPVWLFLDLGV